MMQTGLFLSVLKRHAVLGKFYMFILVCLLFVITQEWTGTERRGEIWQPKSCVGPRLPRPFNLLGLVHGEKVDLAQLR